MLVEFSIIVGFRLLFWGIGENLGEVIRMLRGVMFSEELLKSLGLFSLGKGGFGGKCGGRF